MNCDTAAQTMVI